MAQPLVETAPQPHHDASPMLMLPPSLDREIVQVLAGVGRELAERKERGLVHCALDAGYLDTFASMAAMSYSRATTSSQYNSLLLLAAVAIEQANLIARQVEGKASL